MLPETAATDLDCRRRFEQEARAVSAPNHPHICVRHDVGREGDTDYLVMEYLDGSALAHRLRKGPLPLDQVLDLGAQIADALGAAHKHGIVHRDLKSRRLDCSAFSVRLFRETRVSGDAPLYTHI